eukprot:GEMP01030000.1.p1 GENE.GEMP01030000.1~~GEMP01030000.1.p1  ORF type:complete len:598 (+),score=153.99 GEMP01030000.1:131-1924(+)
MFNDNPNDMLKEDGAYDFTKREERNYKHSYQYFGGWLGQEEVEKEKARKKALGKIDMQPVAPPPDQLMCEMIEKIAKHVVLKKPGEERRIFEKMIREKNAGNYQFCFMDDSSREVAGLGAIKSDTPDGPIHAIAGDKGEQQKAREYYLFVKHCEERQVDFKPLALKQAKLEKDRDEKLKRAKRPPEAPQNPGAEKSSSSTAKAEVPKQDEPEEPMFNDGARIEILCLEKRADLNGQLGVVVKFYKDLGRYEVRLDKFGTVIKVKPANIAYATVQTDTADREQKEKNAFGELPKDAKVEIFGLQSEAARWLNGQEGFVVGYDEEAQRYEVKLLRDAKQIKRVKLDNMKLSLPEGWVEYFDEHAQRPYYINPATKKVTWKHPIQATARSKFDTVVDANEDLEDADFEERDGYDCDDLEECEGQFNLEELVKKVQAREEGATSDDEKDGEPAVKKPKLEEETGRPKKKQKGKKPALTFAALKAKLEEMKNTLKFRWERTDNLTKESVQKELSEAQSDLDLELNAACEEKREASVPKRFQRRVLEALIMATEIIGGMLENQPKSKFTFQGLHRLVDKLDSLETPRDFLNEVDYVHSLLKTM